MIDHDGSVLSVYDKLHLVPFGEYLPFQDWMEKLGFVQLTKVHGGFIPGTRRRAMEIPNAPRALPLICYEAIFPGDIAARDDRPGWIINLTNDGWFGNSTGPYQHLQQARLRAIEEGLPMVRAANTGISAVIDPSGRIVARLGLGIEGVLDASLPSAAAADGLCSPWRYSGRDHRGRRLAVRRPAPRCEATLPEICASLVRSLVRLQKTFDCAVPPVDRQPAIRFLRLQAKNNNQSVHCSDRPQFYPILRAGFDGTGA